jgi:catechol 2,3-dioxygenase-like lactoylglutathione lyase family enzyme
MGLPARVTLVTLGVADLPRAIAFYEALGWERVGDEPDVAFFRTAGPVLALWSTDNLAEDARIAGARGSFDGVALAINLESEVAVDDGLATAVAAGATLLKPAERVFWGGYSGYFADPDGHAWEVAYNPGWPLDERGLPQLP